MANDIKNVFISHLHKDDEGLDKLKDLTEKHGLTVRDSSITAEKPNKAKAPDYIKNTILAPQIRWASVLVVYISPDTKNSEYVDWEIEYAHKQGKRIVGVWEWVENQCALPDSLEKYGDALVGWSGEDIVSAIVGGADKWHRQDGKRYEYRNIERHSC